MRKALITLILLCPLILFAQSAITGKIMGAESKAPIVSASIFLNNTSIGSISAGDGAFTLRGVRNGQYDLVVSSIGYETYHQDVRVNNEDITLPDIILKHKVNVLKEVKINLDPNRAEHLRTFIKEFLGSNPNARDCKILNTDVIDLRYSKRTGILKASSDEFILIENKALGYNIKYLLQLFTLSRDKNNMYYAGSAIFEPMQGTPEEEKAWEAKRLAAFNGSTMHFLRSSLHNQLVDELFFVTDDNNKKITEEQILKRTDVDGIYAFTYPKPLRVFYGKKRKRQSTITFNENDKYAFFDLNGVIVNPQSNTLQGDWGYMRMAELLPVDYRRPNDIQ